MPATPRPLIDIRPDHWAIVLQILQEHVPQYEVWAFGSRAKWMAKEHSDLDLAVISDQPLSLSVSAALADDFSESDLPWKVDVVDWATTSESFRKTIVRDKVVVQEARPFAKGDKAGGVEWRSSTWGEEISLEYGKALRGYEAASGKYRVFGSNGAIGWTAQPLAPGPGVILGRKGAYRGVQYSPDPFYVIDTAYYVAPKTDLDMRWLYYAIQYYKLGEVNDGSPIPSTTRSAVYVMDLEVPPPREQRAIAHILGTLDDKIELNRRINVTLETMARALFKSWFVDFDPVRARAENRNPGLPKPLADLFPDSFEDSELGEIPKGWQVRGLDELARFVNGLALQKYPAGDGESLPVIKIAQLRAGHTNGADRASLELPPDFVVEDGDVLFSWSGSLECVLWAGGRGALNQHLFKVTSDEFPKWLYYLSIGRHLADFRHTAAAKATTMGHIQRHHLSEAKVVIPPKDFLAAADRHFGPLIDAIPKLLVQSRSLGVVRDELLPKLVSGKVRIENAAAFLGGGL